MPTAITYPYQQYGGVWTLSQASDAVAQGKWPSPPSPYLWSWGSNSYGQLGLGDTANRSSPVQVGALTTWLNIAGGSYHVIATQTDGTIWSWGQNNYGQLGLGNTTFYSSPKQIGSLTTWNKIVSGIYHNTSIKTNGTLWSWGFNLYGQLGLGNKTYYSSPKQVGALTTWSILATSNASALHSSAIKTDGTLWTWGSNNQGQLGAGSLTDRSSPAQVGLRTSWTKIASGNSNILALALT